MNPLSRINLILGQNNAGKTSLLEALFLLSAGANPHIALNHTLLRKAETMDPSACPELFWSALFNGFDTAGEVEISANHDSLGQLALKLSLRQPEMINVPAEDSVHLSIADAKPTAGLTVSFAGGEQPPITGHILATGDGYRIEGANAARPLKGMIVSPRTGISTEDARRLGELRRRKQGHLLAEALRLVDPRLVSVESNSAAGVPMIWGDIGLPELVPLNVMGEGMTRMAHLFLAITAAPGGIVLIDDIEHGLHYSVLEKVWQAVSKASSEFNTQIVVSTQSLECIFAARNALDGQDLRVHRLDHVDGEISPVSYNSEELASAISCGLEVR